MRIKLLHSLFGYKRTHHRVSKAVADAATARGTIIPVERLPVGYVQRFPDGEPFPVKSLYD